MTNPRYSFIRFSLKLIQIIMYRYRQMEVLAVFLREVPQITFFINQVLILSHELAILDESKVYGILDYYL